MYYFQILEPDGFTVNDIILEVTKVIDDSVTVGLNSRSVTRPYICLNVSTLCPCTVS